MLLIFFNWKLKKILKITKIKAFINKYHWEGKNYSSEKDNGKNLKKLLLMFYMLKMKKYSAYVSKHNSNCEKQVIFLMNPNGEVWHYLAVKKLSALSKEITSKDNGDFYCLNCLHYFRNLNHIKKYVKIKIFVILLCFLKALKYYNLISTRNLIKYQLSVMEILNV